jgi:hypothetical protein
MAANNAWTLAEQRNFANKISARVLRISLSRRAAGRKKFNQAGVSAQTAPTNSAQANSHSTPNFAGARVDS